MSYDELIRGEGSSSGGSVQQPVRNGAAIDHPESAGVRVPIYDAELSAGPEGRGGEDAIVGYGEFWHWWLRRVARIDPERAFLVPVKGDSMRGLFEDDDLVLGELVDEVDRDAIYAVRLNGLLHIKRLQRGTEDGRVVLLSENPAYDPIIVRPTDDFEVIGRVKRRIVPA